MARRQQETTAEQQRDRQAEIENELRQIVLKALEEYVEPESTDGTGWHSPLWQVVRTVKGAFEWKNVDGLKSWRTVSSVVEVENFIEADSRLFDEEDAAAAWANAWDKVRFLPGETLLDAALREADANPVVPPRDRGKGYGRFLSLCAMLARECPTAPCGFGEICIPVERWGELLDVRPNTVSVWRQWAIQDGALELSQPHSYSGRRAAEFAVRFDILPPVRGTL